MNVSIIATWNINNNVFCKIQNTIGQNLTLKNFVCVSLKSHVPQYWCIMHIDATCAKLPSIRTPDLHWQYQYIIGSSLSYSSNKTVPTNNRILMRHEGIWFFNTMSHRCAQIVNVSRFESRVQGLLFRRSTYLYYREKYTRFCTS